MQTISTVALLGAILLGPLSAQKWPTTLSPEPRLAKHTVEATETGFLYTTTNYRVATSQKIATPLIANFVLSAESVALALKSLPLPLFAPPIKGKPLIQLAHDAESYATAGGSPGTAGFYNGHTQKVLIQWEQLNRTPPASQLLPRPTFDLLVHELTHLCMHETLWKMEPWLVEGVAEYLAAAHLSQGKFNFTKIDAQIRDHLRRQSGVRGPHLSATNIKLLLQLNSRHWLRRTAVLPPAEALQSYTSALLLTHFAFHGGAERRQEVSAHLAALEKVSTTRDPIPTLFPLTEATEIEQKIKAYWSTRGLKLEFK